MNSSKRFPARRSQTGRGRARAVIAPARLACARGGREGTWPAAREGSHRARTMARHHRMLEKPFLNFRRQIGPDMQDGGAERLREILVAISGAVHVLARLAARAGFLAAHALELRVVLLDVHEAAAGLA